ncbi:hypothetical protein LCI18_012362 [Fusarium solani-melongenae]|uniref:Uncharacterized protein n=1 Tax=Fusarium solani subsp. cucurbitae TaxID=2747967 RepID=A0ACD3ZKF4_FUSSC|nr:hypothetical protein LCI18_012362 [Fusarium solani-melongenae]
MSLAKRNNGCYECCKRRLKCDKTEPECLKCQKKGISCSGQGLRCRFSNHMVVNPRTPGTQTLNLASRPSPSQSSIVFNQPEKSYRWVDAGQRVKKGRVRRSQESEKSSTSSPETVPDSASSSTDDSVSEVSDTPSERCTVMVPYAYQTPLRPAPDESSRPRTRMLFSHFANTVAPVMVVLDSLSNGYRDIILPLACQDEVLERAVSVVSAFHLAQKAPGLRPAAEAGHHAIVTKLRRDSLKLTPEQLFNPYTLATILVLLVGETITGADNYTYLLEMLNCLAQSPESIAALPRSLREFFLQQIKMFQLFGFPLSDERKGLRILTGPADDYLDFMSYPDLGPDSEHYTNMELMRSAIHDACGIYRRRAESSLSQDESIHLIEQMRQKVLGLDCSTKGAHALVWTYFIAAAESILPEHREFFSGRLKSLYQVTGFGSIPVALQALKTIWSMQGTRRWTEIVSTDTPILIM